MVKCKGCGKIFTSEFQMIDTSSWHKPVLMDGISQNCPDCGKTETYFKDDHFFQ